MKILGNIINIASLSLLFLTAATTTTWADAVDDPVNHHADDNESSSNNIHNHHRKNQNVAPLAVVALELIEVLPGPDVKVKDIVPGDDIVQFNPSFNINAVTIGRSTNTTSVIFAYNTNTTYKIENTAPYAFCGNVGPSYTQCTVLGFGTHTVTATPYSGPNGTGDRGESLTMTFTISAPQVTALELIQVVPGPSPDSKVKDLVNGDDIEVDRTPSYNINAIVSGSGTKSVVFAYNGNETYTIENNAAYAFCGNVGPAFNLCTVLGYGTHTVTATPYSGRNGSGTAGKSMNVTFRISQRNYDVDVEMIDIPMEDQAFFINAKARWEQIIKGDVQDVDMTGATIVSDPEFARCTLPTIVDDVRICATYTPIEEPNVVGFAFVDYYRFGGSHDYFPINGYMAFNSYEIDYLRSEGGFYSTILHEIGHILGFGTAWLDLGIVDSCEAPLRAKFELSV